MWSNPNFTDEELEKMSPQEMTNAVRQGKIDIPSYYSNTQERISNILNEMNNLYLQKRVCTQPEHVNAIIFQLEQKKEESNKLSKTMDKIDKCSNGKLSEYARERGKFTR